MKNLLAFVLFLSSLFAAAQRFEWVSFTPLTAGNSGSGALYVTTDLDNNIYTVAVFNDPIIVGGDTLYHGGNLNRPDIVVVKWNENGEVLNYRHFYNFSTNGNPDPQGMEWDATNNVLLISVSSFYSGTPVTLVGDDNEEDLQLEILAGSVLRFDSDLNFVSKLDIPGGSTYYSPIATKDGFVYAAHGYSTTVSKLDSENNVVWSLASSVSMTTYTVADVVVTDDDFLYVLGYYTDGFNTNQPISLGDITVTPPTGGASYMIIFKLDLDGNVVDGGHAGIATSYLNPIRMTSDASNNIYIASGYAIPDQVIGDFTLGPLTGATDGFVVKLTDLVPQWVTELHHTGGNLEMRDIVVNENGKVTVIGLYGGNANMGGTPLATASFGTGFLVQMNDMTGEIGYATNLGALSAGTGRPNTVAMVGDKYYIGGQSFGTSTNDNPNAAAYGCFHNTKSLVYLTYFHDVPPIEPTVNLSFEAPLLTATANSPEATFQWFLDGELLEDETGNTIDPDADGVYEVEVTLFGCTANDQYQYCFVAGTDEVDACNSFTWIDGNTYTEDTDDVTYSLVSSTGCDSLVTLNLHIHEVDLTVSVSGNDISSNFAGGSAYQWFDCDAKMTLIDGATEQSYSVTSSGNYAVQITTDYCELMSDCGEVIFIGVEENEGWNISLYPNPASDFIVVDKLQGKNQIHILDASGRLIQQITSTHSTQYISIEALSSGIYFIQIDSGFTLHTQKLVVERD